LFWPAVITLLLTLPLLSPTNNNGLSTPAYRAFLSFQKNPAFRSANYYAVRGLFLLYKNDPVAAQKEYDEFLKIIAVYPGKIDIENEWGAIHKIQECRERITASTLV